MADFRNVPADQKKEVGMRLNELKNKCTGKALPHSRNQFENRDHSCDDLDLTRSAYPVTLGTRHPLFYRKERNHRYICPYWDFTSPKVPKWKTTGMYFPSMNFPEDHPARDMQDTFFIESNPDILLRNITPTHTSSVQSRVMEDSQPPYPHYLSGPCIP